VLASAGTSDEAANDTTRAFAARLAAELGRPVTAAFASAAEPAVAQALSPGCTVLRWLLSPGYFADRIAETAAGHPGAELIVVTDVIGDHPAVADLLLARYDAAAAKIS
jgi:sirohydrochlorin ferrochelatase